VTTLRLIDTGLGGARWNVAMTAALAELHAAGRIPDTLRVHRYPPSVLLGRSRPLRAPVRAACARRGAEIARRVTGGGAVAMTPGVLAWDLVTARGSWPSLDAASAALGGALVAAHGRLGIATFFRAPGDLLAAGRKLAGTAGLFDGPTLLWQGMLLVDANPAELADLLGLRSVPLTSLAGFGVRRRDIAAVLATAMAAALGRSLRPACLGESERALAARLMDDEIGTEEFVRGEAA
jgi:lipoate-protein ligase A